MDRIPAHIMDLFSPDNVVDMSVYVDDCRCQCREHITVRDGLLNVHGRPIFDRLLIKGDLLLPDNQEIRRLPDLLAVTGTVNLGDCLTLNVMPTQMFASRIFLEGTRIRNLPSTLVADLLDLTGCPNIEEIPAGTDVLVLKAAGCSNLKTIAAGLKFESLDLSGTGVSELPADLTITNELGLRRCLRLALVNEGVRVGSGIDVRGCDMLFTLPRSVQPLIAITDGMMVLHDRVIVPTMSSEEAAMCLGVKAVGALPHRHFKNLDRMQEPVVAIDRGGRTAGRGRAVATLGSGAKPLPPHHIFRPLVSRLDERLVLPATAAPKLLR